MLIRILAAMLLIALLPAVFLWRTPMGITGLATAALAIRLLFADDYRRSLLMLWPITLFAGVLAALQWIGGTLQWQLPLRSVAVFLLATSAAGLIPWDRVLLRVKPLSSLYTIALFLLILKHFVQILGTEARRLMIARRLAVTRRYGAGWFTSLTWATAGIFRRSLVRAERFYASQLMRGLAE